MRVTFLRFVPLATFTAAGLLLFACPPVDSDGDDDEDSEDPEVLDGGVDGEGEGEEGEGEEGEGEEGEGELPICDGGLCPDAGVEGVVYVGEEEPGVVCDATTCADPDAVCCVFTPDFATIESVCVASEADCTQGLFRGIFPCDGPEDCDPLTEECCLHQNLTTTCEPAGTCQVEGQPESVVCIDGTDCLADELCCGVSFDQFDLPVDFGSCAAAADNCEL